MYWANFLHLYQPANQQADILDRVVHESYEPLFQSLADYPQIKISLNINGALTEQLQEKYPRVLDNLRLAANRNQIEFTDSAKYHALLPLIPDSEIRRQIILNRQTNEQIIGPAYHPVGFFPPEMAYAENLPAILSDLGYQWIIIDEISRCGKIAPYDRQKIYKIAATNLTVYFRERIPSNLIMSALVRRIDDLNQLFTKDYMASNYLITGMDGETFGHHRPGLHQLLVGLLLSNDFKHVFFSELPAFFTQQETISPVSATWASTEKDVENNVQFLTWNDPSNPVHGWQWELQQLALEKIEEFDPNDPKIASAREKLDKALSSDHFFWASARPWWSLEVVEAGAWALLDAINTIPDVAEENKKRARNLYLKIIATIFEWQRTGYIKKIYKEYRDTPRVPFKNKTSGEPWVYQAFLEMMKTAMKKAAEKENFEEAVLWRDAIWKLETKNDIYDAIHAVDLLRKQVDNNTVMAMIEKYLQEYQKVVSGQPEPRG